jgi:hypothetical protein
VPAGPSATPRYHGPTLASDGDDGAGGQAARRMAVTRRMLLVDPSSAARAGPDSIVKRALLTELVRLMVEADLREAGVDPDRVMVARPAKVSS